MLSVSRMGAWEWEERVDSLCMTLVPHEVIDGWGAPIVHCSLTYGLQALTSQSKAHVYVLLGSEMVSSQGTEA